jgi:hypothetical protein
MKADLPMQALRSCTLAVLLLLVSFFASGSATTHWNGSSCLPGSQNGYPLPFEYTASRSQNYPLQTATPLCTSNASISGAAINFVNVVLDYLFWLLISVPIVILSTSLLLHKSRDEVDQKISAPSLTSQ